ncbi:MAG: hypothetical protein INR73_21630 [Williamsia sp.]|nr:hypothetical protein [Williamsia sp.]
MLSREEREKIHEHLLALLPEVREELKKIPGVTSVAIGLKEVDFSLTDEIVFQVLVDEKKQPHELQPEEMVPKEIRGVKTDVMKILHAAPHFVYDKRGDDLPHHTDEDPLTAGVMVGFFNTHGTLGCFARLKNDPAQLVMLSNHHVLADGRPDGAMVGQPFYSEGCCCCCAYPENHTGYLLGEGVKDKKADCAIATVNSNLKHKPIISNTQSRKKEDPAQRELHIKGTQKALSGDVVVKIGCISGFTTGIIKSLAYTVIDPNTNADYMVEQITIVPHPAETYISSTDLLPAFSEKGDSGAVVLHRETGNVVALLWGGDPELQKEDDPDKNKDKKMDTTFATHIDVVLKALEEKGYPIEIEKYTDSTGSTPLAAARTVLSTPSPNDFAQRLQQHPAGKKWAALAAQHRTEVMHLINHERVVSVAWQRNQGPAFTAHIAKSAQDPAHVIPDNVNGISLQQLLIKMGSVLTEKGSGELRTAIEKHTLELLAHAENLNSVESLLTRLNEPLFA